MISHFYKCIFIHIPKCGGTSIEEALGHLENHTGRGGQDHRCIRHIENPYITLSSFSSKENIRQIYRRFKRQYFLTDTNPRNKYTVTRIQYDQYFKFAFVRNPWARAFSWYKNVMRDEVHKKDLEIQSQISFNRFLQLYAGIGMLRPQTYWIKNFKGLISLDYIGRYENLTEDFGHICRKMKLSNIKLPHRLKGDGEDYREYYDNITNEIISNVYRDEIEMFGYSFNC